jgi:RimJ/RimL family protein N-acetyltransferase
MTKHTQERLADKSPGETNPLAAVLAVAPVIDLGLCAIRRWREADAASLARHANSRPVWENLRDTFPHPYTRIHATRFLARASIADRPRHFAIVVGEEAVGGISYHLPDDAPRSGAELGYWLNEAYWGRGIATAAVRAVTASAFSAHATLHRIYAISFAWNAASARALEKSGYTFERTIRQGAIKHGRTVDQLLHAIIREGGKNCHAADR